MFDLFSWSHVLILLTVALVVVGPKDLPRLMHMAGRWAGKARAMANEFKKSFDEMARQSELDELRKEIETLRANQTFSELQTELSQPVGAASEQQPLDMGPEPRAGEFAITETPAAPQAAPPQATSESSQPVSASPEAAPATAPKPEAAPETANLPP